ncbi:3-deoxy-D-manno-octulosonic-acid transferase [Arcticibacter pallidicorallinus]|uniref:3-deoxy-D-manno-octulosonic acid transferase n=1 Tax=Arcticibacter pallidicorallinus TaxID=1259464 RepID=A0A2T0U9F5_9SPHI|nr:glycosyltransferase N-terminal domain-containing protein [Arcticibacter pallidicorallinus]PRY54554.1 3-deoxy-D-manno-octulosonic-acid transferase [Arcticibacter pallidicorallinus]
MLFIYNLGIQFYWIIITISQAFNIKAKTWLKGRKNLFQKIKQDVNSEKEHIWFHFASLGEFEQGRPVIEKIKSDYPDYPVVITFFSPSGYELRKNYSLADHVFYLPLDTKRNARQFVEIINPKLAIFTKYEYWYHFFTELDRRNIPLIVISAIFRKEQLFFKWYGSLHRSMLRKVSRLFVQDAASISMLENIGIMHATIGGDTRFDRVAANAEQPKDFQLVRSFCDSANIFVGGSTWPDDENLISKVIAQFENWKFIIAPHEIKPDKLKAFESLLPDKSYVRYSDLKNDGLSSANKMLRVLIIDNIGMLSSLYQYGQIAYIGGGFGVGIHNTLEAAAFGLPVIFGPNYKRFLEAKMLISEKAAFSIKNEEELLEVMTKLQDSEFRKGRGSAAKRLVSENTGATEAIFTYLNERVFN